MNIISFSSKFSIGTKPSGVWIKVPGKKHGNFSLISPNIIPQKNVFLLIDSTKISWHFLISNVIIIPFFSLSTIIKNFVHSFYKTLIFKG